MFDAASGSYFHFSYMNTVADALGIDLIIYREKNLKFSKKANIHIE